MHHRLLQLPLALLCAAAVLIAYPEGGHSQAKPAASSYVVKSGDTLLSIAEAVRPQEATMNQMALALFRANLRLFQTRDTLQVSAGTKLDIPPAATVLATDAAKAQAEFDRLWRADQHYRAGVALEKSKDMLFAFVSYVEAAKLGSGRAQLRLARLYDNDLSGFVKHDLQESAQWYDKARQNEVQFATQRGRSEAIPSF